MATKKKKDFKRSVLFCFGIRIQVLLAKVAWRNPRMRRWVTFAPEGVWGSASGDLRSPPCGGFFWSSPSLAAHPFQRRKSTRRLPGSSDCLPGQQMMERPAFLGGVCWGQSGAKCDRDVRQRDGGEEAPWQRVSSVKLYIQCCWFLMCRSKNRSKGPEWFSNIVVLVKHPGQPQESMNLFKSLHFF